MLYGGDLSNRVQYIGREGSGGNFRGLGNSDRKGGGPGKCPQLMRAINEAGYDYVVTTPELDLNQPATARPSPERGWMLTQSGAEEVLHRGRVSVFRIDSELKPGECRTRAEPAEAKAKPGK